MRRILVLLLVFWAVPVQGLTPENTPVSFGSVHPDTPGTSGQVAVHWSDPSGDHWVDESDSTVLTVDYLAVPYVSTSDTSTLHLDVNDSADRPFTLENRGNGSDTFSTELYFESFEGSTDRSPKSVPLEPSDIQSGSGSFTLEASSKDDFDTARLVFSSNRKNKADTQSFTVRFTNPELRINRWVFGDTQYTLQDGSDTTVTSDTYSMQLSVTNTGNVPLEFASDSSDYRFFNEMSDTITSTFYPDTMPPRRVERSDTTVLVYDGTLPDSTIKQAIGPVQSRFDTTSLHVVSVPDSSEVEPDSIHHDTNVLSDWSKMFIQPSMDQARTIRSVDDIVEVDLPPNKYPNGTRFSTITQRDQMDTSCIKEADDDLSDATRYPSLDTSTVIVEHTQDKSNDDPLTVNLEYNSEGVPETERIRQRLYVLNESTCRWEPAQDPDQQIVDLNQNYVQAQRDSLSTFRVLVAPLPDDLDDLVVAPNPFKPNDGLDQTGQPYQFGDRETGIYFENVPADSTIDIVDIHGRLVRRIDVMRGGNVQWDVRNGTNDQVASDVYLYRVKHDGQVQTGKIGIVR